MAPVAPRAGRVVVGDIPESRENSEVRNSLVVDGLCATLGLTCSCSLNTSARVGYAGGRGCAVLVAVVGGESHGSTS